MRPNVILPIVPKLADQIKRAGDENGVVGRGLFESKIERLLRGGNDPVMRSVVGRDFGEPGRGDGARSAWLRKNDFYGMGEKLAGDFVDGFIAERAEEKPDFAAGKVLLEEFGEFACGSGIVRAI